MSDATATEGAAVSLVDALKVQAPATVFESVFVTTAPEALAMMDVMQKEPMAFASMYRTNRVAFEQSLVYLRAQAPYGTKTHLKEIVNTIKLLSQVAETPKKSAPRRLIDTLDPLPPVSVISRDVLSKLRAPKNYVVRSDGVFRVTGADEEGEPEYASICAEPVFVAGLSQNATDGSHMVTLAYRSRRRWQSKTFPQGMLATGRNVEALATAGIEVDANTTRHFIQYIKASRIENRGNLPHYTVSSSLGWINRRVFLLPTTVFVPPGDTETHVLYEPDPSTARFTKAVAPKGSFTDAVEVFNRLSKYPWICIGTYASLSSVMLDLLVECDAKPFMLDIGGPSGTGKTRLMDWMGAMWGEPQEFRTNWEHTNNRLQLEAHVRGSLPLLLDELKRRYGKKGSDGMDGAKNLVYAIHDGAARAGLTNARKGTEQFKWWLVAAGSNETSMIQMAKGVAGLRARMVPVVSPVFGQRSEDARNDINYMGFKIRRHYGHIGPRFAAFLVVIRQDAGWMKHIHDYYYQQRSNFQTWWGNDVAADRCCDYLATISTTQMLFHHLFAPEGIEAPACGESAIMAKYGEAVRMISHFAADADRQLVALGRFLMSRPGDVLGLNQHGTPSVVYAYWPSGKNEKALILTVAGLKAFEAASSDMGVDARTLVNMWGQKGFLVAPPPGSKEANHISEFNDWYGYSVVNRTVQYKVNSIQHYQSIAGWPVRWEIARAMFVVQDIVDPTA